MKLGIGLATLTWLACAAAFTVGAEEGDAIWHALLDTPPSVPQTEARDEALKVLDAWIGQPDSEQSSELVSYYRRAVDRVISTLETSRPKKGVRCFQLYSSSVIVQTPSCVFAIDLDQGPNKDLQKTPEQEGVAFCMTDMEVDRLAQLIDYSFHTHEHSDHIDYELTQAFMEHDKTVIVTASTKRMWSNEPWADRLVVLEQTLTRPVKVGNLEVDVLWDEQWGDDEHTKGTPCNAFIIKTDAGVTVGTKGDINCGLRLYGWLNVLVEAGHTIDIMVGSPIFWHGANLTRQIDALITPLWAPGHNWEFEHRPLGETRGNCSTFTQSYASIKHAAKHGAAVVLSWGEYLDVLPDKHAGRS